MQLSPLRAAALLLALAHVFSSAEAQLVRHPNTTLQLPATLQSGSTFTTENALGTMTFTNPIALATPPGENNRLFVAQRGGTIMVVDNLSTTPVRTTFLNLAGVPGLVSANVSRLVTNGENGLLGLAFHPRYSENGFFFVFYSFEVNEGTVATPVWRLFQRVARFRVSAGNPNVADPLSHTPLITQVDRASNHNGGDIHFGPDGYLYVSVGDEGGGNDQFDNARHINRHFFGAMLRIDVDNKPENLAPNTHSQSSRNTTFPSAIHPGTYRIPADNPFIGATSWHGIAISPASVRTEIWATGLRNPWRFSFDPATGRLFCADVGQGAWEEVDIITRGGDFGWSWREGFQPFTSGPSPTTPPATGFNPINPIHAYGRGDGFSVTGGVVLRGNRLPELYGTYLFADYGSNRLWALRQNNNTWAVEFLTSAISNVVAFGVDPRNGDALIAEIGTGVLKRLRRATTTGTPPPNLLSGTGAFSDLQNFTPHEGIVPYDVNLPFWSDHATKRRWFSVPTATATIGFSTDGNWTFPTGSVWIKHFDLEMQRGDPASKRRIETRFFVKTASGAYGVTYKWRADQSEADLVVEEGEDEVFNIQIDGQPATQTWRYPSRSECLGCHTPIAGHALGFNTRQLNRLRDFGSGDVNQIAALSSAGYFTEPVSGAHAMPYFAHPADEEKSLEFRVRSYLAVNCVQCHQPNGPALGNWDGRPTTRTDAAGIINGALVNDGGNASRRFVVPGNPDASMLLLRLAGLGGPRMPPITINETDAAAVELITRWINEDLPQRESFEQWQTVHFGSTTSPAAQRTADPDGDGDINDTEFLTRKDPRDPAQKWRPVFGVENGVFQFTFEETANRGFVIETTTDFQTWTPWEAAGNAPNYRATTQMRTLSAPVDVPNRFFRARIREL